MKDYYKILGVSDTAEVEVIAAAYRALMHKYYPDTNPSPSSAEKAKDINEAYAVLCDAGRRRHYDEQHQTGKGGQSQEQDWARQEQERAHKEQAERQKREQDAQARERQEREKQGHAKREVEQRHHESQEREAAARNSSSEKNNANKATPEEPSKKFYRSQIFLLSAPLIAGLVVVGLTSTGRDFWEQSASKINDENYDAQAAYAFEIKDVSRLRDLATKGHSSAQFYLGLSYDKGEGVTEDDIVAVGWYNRAADQGNVKAQYNLGVMHATGQGVPQYYAAAAEWFRKAAEQGDVRAQYRLGLAYSTGTVSCCRFDGHEVRLH